MLQATRLNVNVRVSNTPPDMSVQHKHTCIHRLDAANPRAQEVFPYIKDHGILDHHINFNNNVWVCMCTSNRLSRGAPGFRGCHACQLCTAHATGTERHCCKQPLSFM